MRFGLIESLSSRMTLVPFNVPQCLFEGPGEEMGAKLTEQNLREIRRVMAFLLERPQALTPQGTMELVAMLVEIAGALEQHISAVAALLKVQFSGLICSYDPMLCHVVLMLHSRFADSFSSDDELGIARRLALIPKDAHHPLVFRLLALHWLLGSPRLVNGKESLAPLMASFYPTVFDPLALKAAKLDAMACVAARIDDASGGERENGKAEKAPVVKLFEDGLVCVSAFKWLPPWSTETAVAFRTLHKFLIGVAPHHENSPSCNGFGNLAGSTIFLTLKSMLVKLALEHRGLVQVIATFVDRLLRCEAHREMGERLLQTFDEHLLPKLETDCSLTSYFPIFERIAGSDAVPPRGLLDLLAKHMVSLTEKHGPDTTLRSWSQGSKVVGICRLMLMHHHSSRVFLGLSNLLAFTCQYFPDLEVRDNARIYLRMLLSTPGKKLRHLLSLGEQTPGVAAPHPGSFFQVPSPRPSQDLKKSSGLASYIHLERVIPLVVKQSWSLTLPNLDTGSSEGSYFDGIGDIIVTPKQPGETIVSPSTEPEKESEINIERISLPPEPLRVMDSKDAEIVGVLRRHFACIPDYRHMPPIKIRIPCILRFESEPFRSSGVDELPALYATTISFSSSAKYGPIPPSRVPFLLGEPPKTGSEIVPVGNDLEKSRFRAPVIIELEPREPMPSLIDVAIKANVENGQIISGSLQSVSVGIEDMFLKARIPSDVTEDEIPDYYLDLFHALWEACGNSANTGRETFLLSGGKGAAAISGTRSVKLLEVTPDSLINSIERYLTPFVVSIIGEPLMNIAKNNGVIRHVIWGDDFDSFSPPSADALVPYSEADALVPYSENAPLQLQYDQDERDTTSVPSIRKRNMGIILVLIFLPPRFHLLFQMEIGEVTTLVRIRTDHWPCLAYVDDYLESLFLT